MQLPSTLTLRTPCDGTLRRTRGSIAVAPKPAEQRVDRGGNPLGGGADGEPVDGEELQGDGDGLKSPRPVGRIDRIDREHAPDENAQRLGPADPLEAALGLIGELE